MFTKESTSSPMNFNINEIEISNTNEIKISNPQEEPTQIDELPEMKIDQIDVPEEKVNEVNENIEHEEEETKSPEIDLDNFNPIIHNDFAGQEINDDDVEFIEEEEPEQEVQPEQPKQMRDVIKAIRECNDVIESYGYQIETEEFDLDTMYQVIFKIYKN